MPDGSVPAPGGWNRFQLEVEDIEAVVARLRDHGARFRNDIVTGVGGKQILVEDPAGNPIELFQPIIPRRSSEALSSATVGQPISDARRTPPGRRYYVEIEVVAGLEVDVRTAGRCLPTGS